MRNAEGEKKKKWTESLFKIIVVGNFLYLGKETDFQIYEVQWAQSAEPDKGYIATFCN